MKRLARRAVVLTLVAIGASAILGVVSLANTNFAKDALWECNRCHQQYIGDNPPPFVKCPATDNKQTHWWIRKR